MEAVLEVSNHPLTKNYVSSTKLAVIFRKLCILHYKSIYTSNF